MRRIPLVALSFVAGCGGGAFHPHQDGSTGPRMATLPHMATPDPGIVSKSGLSVEESETHVAIAPNGYVAVAYIGLTASGSNNGYRISTDQGDTFAMAEALKSPMGRETSDPVLAVDSKSN